MYENLGSAFIQTIVFVLNSSSLVYVLEEVMSCSLLIFGQGGTSHFVLFPQRIKRVFLFSFVLKNITEGMRREKAAFLLQGSSGHFHLCNWWL